jgi:hypothetical protein
VGLVVLALGVTYWLTLQVWRTGEFDVPEYARYARAFWLGQPRFTTFPQEYPPLALLPFILALLPGFLDPLHAFGLWMAALFLAGYLGFVRFATWRPARRYAGYLLLAGQATLLARYDLVPALATLAALWAAERRRFTLAYVFLAAGILLKVYPIVLLPAVMIAQARSSQARHAAADETTPARGWRASPGARFFAALPGAAFCVGLVAATLFATYVRSPQSALSFLSYAAARPVQVESLPATLLWLATFVGVPATYTHVFASDAYISPLAGPVSALATGALVAGCLAVYWRQWRGQLTLAQACLLAVCLVVLTSKVFSTQYVVWVLPLAAAVGGLEPAWALIAALTLVDYPLLYPFNQPDYTSAEAALFMLVMALRNGLLLAVTVLVLLRGVFARRRGLRGA